MGREIKRVPLNFDWPLQKTWAGFLNPYEGPAECEYCEGSGYTPEAKHISDQWYGYSEFHPSETGSTPFTVNDETIRAFVKRNRDRAPEYYGIGETGIRTEVQRLINMWNGQWSHHLEQADVDALLAEGRLFDLTRNGRIPTVKEVNEWHIMSMGHDAINHYVCVAAKLKRLGIEGTCLHCQGNGEYWASQTAKELFESWEATPVPEGEGWQLWETVSEGSPMSPVFTTDTELVDWLVGEGYSPTAAAKFVKSGWSPSAMILGNEMKASIECMDFTNEPAANLPEKVDDPS